MTNTSKLVFSQQGKFKPLCVTPEKVRLFCVYSFLAAKCSKNLQFQKYGRPCNAKLYKTGDSWTEYLSINEHAFRRLRKMVCVSYNSMKDFMAEEDPFKGMPFAAYHHKLMKSTYYLLNPKYEHMQLSEFLEMIGLKPWNYRAELKRVKDKNKPLYPQNGENKSPIKKGSLKGKENYKRNHETAMSMMKIWRSIVGGQDFVSRKRDVVKIFSQKLRIFFSGSLEKWHKYCERIRDLNRWYEKNGLKIYVSLMGSLSEFYINLKREKTVFKPRQKVDSQNARADESRPRESFYDKDMDFELIPPMSKGLGIVIERLGISLGWATSDVEKMIDT